jgi:hypothetical protein
MPTTTIRPADAELVTLLRRERDDILGLGDLSPLQDARVKELRQAADALEAASAEPFEVKIRRAAEAHYNACHFSSGEWEAMLPVERVVWLGRMEVALRAAGVEG